MLCSAMCLLRFMVESRAQSGRMRTLINPGSIAWVQVMGDALLSPTLSAPDFAVFPDTATYSVAH